MRGAVAELAAGETQALTALEGLDGLLAGEAPGPALRAALEATLWRLLPSPEPIPTPAPAAADPLSERYRELAAEEPGR